ALAAVDDTVRASGGRPHPFPDNRVVVRVLTGSNDDRPSFKAVFADLDARMRERLEEIRCEAPAHVEYVLSLVAKVPADWPEGRVFSIDCQQRAGDAGTAPAAPSPLTVDIEVVEG